MIHKLKIFLSLNISTKLLFLEAFLFLGWARILKGRPFSKVAPSLGLHMTESPLTSNENSKTLKQISYAIQLMSRYTLWESKCLVKAMAGMKMLERRKIGSTLYLGTAKDETGKLIAHAWLRSGSFYISGAEEMESFTIVSKFAKRVSEGSTEGENSDE